MKANRLIIAVLLLIPPISYYVLENHFADEKPKYSSENPLEKDRFAPGQVRILLNKIQGVRITYVSSGGLLDELGLKVGDLVYKVNGTAPKTKEEFTNELKSFSNGKSIYLELYRSKEKMTISRSH